MTSTTEIITICLAALGLLGGFFAYAMHVSNRLALTERDSGKALQATEAHTVQLAITNDHAETALALGKEHTKALADTGARVASTESTLRSIAASLEQLPLLRDDIGEMKTAVGVLTSQMADTRTDVQECTTSIAALGRPRRSAAKKRKR